MFPLGMEKDRSQDCPDLHQQKSNLDLIIKMLCATPASLLTVKTAFSSRSTVKKRKEKRIKGKETKEVGNSQTLLPPPPPTLDIGLIQESTRLVEVSNCINTVGMWGPSVAGERLFIVKYICNTETYSQY